MNGNFKNNYRVEIFLFLKEMKSSINVVFSV